MKEESLLLCPITIYQLEIKSLIRTVIKLIFAVCVYKYILWGFSISFFFNQSCCPVHSKVTSFP
ncbi:hypothetical protein ACRRTK_001501 [Alexandromys fortis]